MKKVFVGCSSYNEIDKKYFKTAEEVAIKLINKNYELVFGCCNCGLMGTVYDMYKNNNKEITAVCTEYYKHDLDSVNCNKVLVSDTNEQINYFMKSDLFVFLPGGYGTYTELFSIINGYVTESHDKKIIIINIDNYYDEIKNILNKIKKEKFAKVFDFVYFIDKIEELDKFL